jgi:hypothetical protein
MGPQSMSISFAVFGLVLTLPALLAGVMMLIAGRWPRRRGDDPHCRRCDYSLIALESTRCPECGTELTPANIVRGQRHRRPGLAWAGAGFILFALVTLVPVGHAIYRGVDWYQYKPTYFVMKDLDSSFVGVSGRAINELIRREKAAELSSDHANQLVERALIEQAAATTGPNASQLVDFAARRFAAGKLTEQQKQKLLAQTMHMSLRIREKVVLGDPVPFQVDERARTPSGWWVRVTAGPVSVDGTKVREGGGGFGTMSGMGSGGATGGSVPCTQPGEHRLEVVCLVAVYDGGTFGETAQRQPVRQEDRTLTGRFTVLSEAPADYIKLISTLGLAPQLQASIVPRDFKFNESAGGRLEGSIEIKSCPVNVAFDVIARYGGNEERLTTLTCDKGNGSDYHISSATPVNAPPATIDIVLRTSEKAARRSIGQYEIWEGELVFPNIPVISPLRDKPASE